MITNFREKAAWYLLFIVFIVAVLYAITLIAGVISGVALIGILAIQGNQIAKGVIGLGIAVVLIVCLSKTSRDILGHH